MTRQLTAVNWQRLTDCLALCEGVVAARLFGSAQDGVVRPGSDIDGGLLFSQRQPG
jgi:predicted nucleotidyltransferase